MSKEKKNKASSANGKKHAGWLKRAFFGGSRTLADEMLETDRFGQRQVSDVEMILSPGKQILKNFLEKKYAVVALVVVILMFILAFIGPFFMPKYFNSYIEVTQQSLYPTMSMMSVPSGLKNNIKQISSYGPFSVGLSNDGKVFVWGCTQIGTTGVDISKIPDEVKNTKIAMVAAGIDHIIAIGEDGKIYGWGNDKLGQYGRKEEFAESGFILPMPEELYKKGIDVKKIKKLTCGYQATAILMEDGTLYIWGNKNSYSNMDFFATMNEYDEDIGFETEPVLLRDVAFTLNYIIGVREAPKSGGFYEPLIFGTATLEAFENPNTNFTSTGKNINTVLADHGNATIERVFATNTTAAYLLSDNSVVFCGTFRNQSRSFVAPPKLSDGEYYVDIATGMHHYTGITNLGNVYSWGEDLLDQCTTPKTVKSAAKVFAGGFQTYTADENGALLQKWGHKGYLFGTDSNGADIFQRIVNGSKMTMTIGGVAVIISTIIGIIVGCLSGYFGGKVDMVLMRVTEVFAAIPFLPFAMILSSIISHMPWGETTRIFFMMCILGFLSWTGLARLIRGQVLVARENEYVTAAKAMGVKESKIAFKHILPNVISIIIVTLTLDFAGCMLTESSLSYLGFGVTPPRPTWGNMLNGANNLTVMNNYWWQWLFTALFLAITTICINIIGDALRDVMDPKSNSER